MKGRGDGTFEQQRTIPVGYAPQAVVVADIDGDELVDLIVSHYGEGASSVGTIAVFLGHGDGTFDPVTNFPGGDRVRSLNAVDLDRDGKLDLVTENAVLLGNGDGTFGAPKPFGSSADYSAAVGDLDGDGREDIVTSDYYAEPGYDDEPSVPNACSVHRGNGDGTFQPRVWIGQGFHCVDADLADLNGDGFLDIVLCNHGDDRGDQSGVLVLPGNGNGTFGAGRLFPTAMNPNSVSVTDVDGDGRLDLVTANTADDFDFDVNSLTILFGNGDLTFPRRRDLEAGRGPIFVAAGQVDTNGSVDLVAANVYQNTVSVFTGNGDGTFGTLDLALNRSPLGLVSSDFDRDGHADLAMTLGGPGPPGRVILGKGDGTFDHPLDLPQTVVHAGASIGTADLNGDLAPDLFFSNAGAATMLATGDGTFRISLQPDPVTRSSLGVATTADFDHDGHPDLAIPQGFNADGITMHLGRGDGSFAPSTLLQTGNYPFYATSGDLNGDGASDLVVGLGGYKLSVLLGHGDGSFAPHVDYTSGNYFANTAPVGLADLNEDGKLDVVNGNLLWFGKGDGTFLGSVPIDTRTADEGLLIEDLDQDHHQDLVFLSADRVVLIYPGRGDGTFGPRQMLATGALPWGLTAGDFDGDHRTDLAVANTNSSSISIYLNRSQAPVIPVRFELRPTVMNPLSDARWVTATVEPPASRSTRDIDVASIRLNGVVPVDRAAPSSRGRDSRELVVRFDRAALAALLPAGDRVPVTITGAIGGDTFEGSTTIQVLSRGQARVSGPGMLLALRFVSPVRGPAGGIRVGFALPEKAPARLDMIDVAGRIVATRTLEAFAAGAHEIELPSTGAIAPGIYFLRLRQGREEVHTKTAIVR